MGIRPTLVAMAKVVGCMRDDRDDVDDGDDGNQGDKARIVTRPTMAMMARLAYLAGALVPVWDCDILDLERGARGYFRCCAIVSCRYYLSSGCAHPPLSCNSITLKGNAHDLFFFHNLYFCGVLSKRNAMACLARASDGSSAFA